MIWTYRLIGYLIIALIAAVIFGFIFSKTIKSKDKSIIGLLTVVATIAVLVMARPFVEPYFYAWTFETSIRSQYPIMELLANKAPDDFRAYINREKSDIVKYGVKNSRPTLATIEFLDAEIAKYSQVATNQSLYDFMKTRLEVFQEIVKEDPTLVLRLEFPHKYIDTNDKSIGKFTDQYNKNMVAAENVIKSALETPQTPPTPEDNKKALALLKIIATDLAVKYGKENVMMTFDDPSNPNLDKTTAAKILLSLYEDIIAKGVNDSAMIVKYVFQNSAPQ